MPALAVLLVILSACIHAFRDFFTKKSGDIRLFVWLFSVAAAILFFPVFLYFAWREGLPWEGVRIALITGFCIHFLYWMFQTEAYKHGDLSHVYPIMRSAPAFVLIFSVLLLDEKVSDTGIAGVVLVTAGAYFINLRSVRLRSLIEPLQAIFSDRTTQYAFLALLTVTAYSIIDKQGVALIHPILYTYLINFFLLIPFTFVIFSTRSREAIMRAWTSNRATILLNGAFTMIGYGLILVAFTMAPASYVVGLRQLSIIFAVLLGGHALRESHKIIRTTAGCIIAFGSFLIALA